MRRTNASPVHRLRHLLAAHDLDAQPDAALLASFAADRDEAAFTTLVRRHSPLVLGTARRVLGNAADADDVFQAVFLTLARKAATIRCDGTLSPWLYRVTFRTALRLRKRTRAAQPVTEQTRTDASDPLTQISARELCSAIDAEVARLSARLRSVVVLCCLQGLTRDEAATQLGWSSATVKRRLALAREVLDRRLRARGIGLPAALGPVLLAVAPTASAETLAGTVGVALGRVTPPARVGALCSMAAARVRTWAAGTVAAGVLTVGLVFGLQPRPEAPPSAASTPVPAGRPAAAAELPADPLPAGAVARIGTTRFRHDEWLSQAVWSADGKFIATTAGGTVIVWEAATGGELSRLTLDPVPPERGQAGPAMNYVRHLHWSRDGRTIFAVIHGVAKRCSWDATKKALQFAQNYQAPEEMVAAAISADGSRFFGATARHASASAPHLDTVRIWPATLPAGATIAGVVVSPTDEIAVIAATGETAEMQVFDMRWDQPAVARFERTVSRMAFSEDGKTFAAVVGEEGKVPAIELWDAKTWKTRLRLDYPSPANRPTEVRALALSPDGRTLVTGADDKTLRWWDTATGKETRREGPGWLYYNRAAFRPDGKALLTVSHENHVRLWDVATGKQLPLTNGPGWLIAATTFTPDGRHVLSVSENVVYCHEAATGRELWRGAEHTDTAVQVAVTPDGRTVISSGNEGRIIFREAATGKVIRSIENPRHATDVIAVSPDGKTIAALGGDAPHDAILRRWDTATGKAYADAPLPPKGPKYVPSAIRYLPDGSGIAIASGTESQVPVFDPDRREFRPVFGPADGGVRCIDLSADGRMVAAGTLNNSVFVWEAASGQRRLLLKDVGDTNCLAFSPDGRILAIANAGKHAGGQRVVRLLDAFTGKEFHQFTGHTGRVYRLAWSPDGRRLVSGSQDASALIWEVSAAIRAKLPTAPLSGDDARKAVTGLSASDGAAAYRDLARLVGSPGTAVTALRGVLRPVSAPDATVVAGLVRDLDNPQFAVREKAAAQLAAFGEGVEELLQKVLDDKPSAEVRDRVEKLLAEVKPADHRVRQGRALELLERIGDADSRQLLTELAAGADGAWLTREAKASLGRLTPPSR